MAGRPLPPPPPVQPEKGVCPQNIFFFLSPSGNEYENGWSGPTPPPMLPKKSASVSHMAGMMGKQMPGPNQDHYEHYIAGRMGQNR